MIILGCQEKQAIAANRIARAVENAFSVTVAVQNHFIIIVAVRPKAGVAASFFNANAIAPQKISLKLINLLMQNINLFFALLTHYSTKIEINANFFSKKA